MLLHRHKFPLLCCGCGGVVSVATGVVARGAAPVDDETAAKNAGNSARQLSWAQVEAMTAGFTSAVVGEGGFSTVYLARLSGGSKSQLAAVKVYRSCSERLRRAFRQELDALLRVRHPHIVRLLAFCDQRDEGMLVLEFAPNGNLHENLHGDVDPHYLRSGVLTKKSDVYSFGVLLLELLTGTQQFHDGRLLTSTVAPMIKTGSCDVHKLVDKRLGCKYDGEF